MYTEYLWSGISCEIYEIHLTVLEKLIKEASKTLSDWEAGIPTMERSDFRMRIKGLKAATNVLEERKTEFTRAQKVAKEKADFCNYRCERRTTGIDDSSR